MRLRTNAAKRMRVRENALYLVFKLVTRLSLTWWTIIDLAPQNPGAHTRLAKLLGDRGELAEARAIYEHVLEFDPLNRIALNRVGGPGQPPPASARESLAAMSDDLRRIVEATNIIEILETRVPGYTWPEGSDTFECGWRVSLTIGGRPRRAWYGLNRKSVHGALRRHSVTWLEGCPPVEAEGADDYARSRCLVSLIKHPGGRHVTSRSDLPEVYAAFEIVVHADEVRAPYAYGSLCVRVKEDDVYLWVRHALLRAAAWGALTADATQGFPRPFLT